MRNPCDVLTRMLAVPGLSSDAVMMLERLRYTASYKSPEQTREMFFEIADYINELVGPPPLLTRWQIGIVAIHMERNEQEVARMYGDYHMKEELKCGGIPQL